MVNDAPDHAAWSRLESLSYWIFRIVWVGAAAITLGAIQGDPRTVTLGLWLWAAPLPLLAAWDFWNAEVGRADGDRRRTIAVWVGSAAPWTAYIAGHAAAPAPVVAAGLAILIPAWGFIGRMLAIFLRRDTLRGATRAYATLSAGIALAALGVALTEGEGLFVCLIGAAATAAAAVAVWRPAPRAG